MTDTSADRPPTQEELFDAVCIAHGRTTISQRAPHGGVMIWVSTNEKDVFKALMKAAATIVASRGGTQPADSPIQITKCAVFAPGAEFYWQVQQEGQILADGYAATRAEAGERIAAYMLKHPL